MRLWPLIPREFQTIKKVPDKVREMCILEKKERKIQGLVIGCRNLYMETGMRFLIFLLVPLIFVGCSHVQRLNELQYGMSKQDVIEKLGMPEHSSMSNSNEILIYDMHGDPLIREWYSLFFVKGKLTGWEYTGNNSQQLNNAANAMSDFGRQLSSGFNNNKRAECTAISIAPIASPGCKNVCINGAWAEVCN